MSIGAPHNEGVLICPEDRARAEVYALLGSLFYAAPSKELLRAIATSKSLCNDDSITAFCSAWRTLRGAAAHADAESVRDEFDTAFIGTGRQPVMLYGSFYITGFLHEKPLAHLREQLTKMGVARRGDRHESEDHISALCDVMRFLVAGDGETPPAGLDAQLHFFREHIAPWYAQLCAAISEAGQAHFYKYVANVLREFFIVENAAFDIE